jgi:hypothetical protein
MTGITDIKQGSPSSPPARSFAEWDALAGHPPRNDEVLEQAFRYATGVGALDRLNMKETGDE